MKLRTSPHALCLLLLACGGSAPPSPAPRAPAPAVSTPDAPNDDAFLYLEDVQGERALAFARAHNAVSEKELAGHPGFKALEERLRAIYSSKEKIPRPSFEAGMIRNFWTDADHPRGLWRQTTLAEYRKKEPAWTTLIDVDALNKAENESWVFHEASCLRPRQRRCLVHLSRGGGDAEVVREFDTEKKEWVKGGFTLPEAKSTVGWKDEDTIYVGTDFGPGSMTTSGYARIMKEWKRGAPLGEAKVVFEGKESDVAAYCGREWDHGRMRDVCGRALDFEHDEAFLREGGKLVKIDKPDDAEVGFWADEIVLRLRSDWKLGDRTHRKGSLVIGGLRPFLEGKRELQVLFEPTEASSLDGWNGTKTRIVVNTLVDVKNEVHVFEKKGTVWVGKPLAENVTSLSVKPFDSETSDDVWLYREDFNLPPSLDLWTTTTGKREPLKKNPSFFDAGNLEVAQHFATSKDGTKIPYFEVGRKGQTGPTPTLLEAYGGFEVSLNAAYLPADGAAWLDAGGTYVQANLRGGGEYGPRWHEAAMKANRQRAYDDLAAVAQDLVQRKVTTKAQLGVIGASNGGLLTSVMLTQHPELFGAIVSQVPLTDMRRFHKLLAGASWMGEYGDPDRPEDWAYLSKFSPLQNIERGRPYPPVLYATSTKDDRVHPGHARKMVAKLEANGYQPLYYENIEGGHGGAADITQRAYLDALVFTFLRTRLGVK